MKDRAVQPHPLATLFPPMSKAEFLALKVDIAEHGICQVVILHQNQVLDGVHRLRACTELGLDPPTKQWNGEHGTPLAYVLACNLQRRHLTESQRAMAAAKLATIQHGGDRSKSQSCDLKRTDAAAARHLAAVVERAFGKVTDRWFPWAQEQRCTW